MEEKNIGKQKSLQVMLVIGPNMNGKYTRDGNLKEQVLEIAEVIATLEKEYGYDRTQFEINVESRYCPI